MSLRKEKAARLKLGILDTTLKLVGRRPFEDLYVEDICQRAKISKVTLFKYYPVKEDILAYYFRVWCLKRTVELRDKPREGAQGVLYLLERLGEDFDQNPGIILSMVAYLASPKRPPKPFPLKPEEKKLIFPDVEDIENIDIMSIEQLMEKFALEGIFKKEFTKTSNTRDITLVLISIFFGSIVTLHMTQSSPTKPFMKRMVDLAVKGM